MGARQYAQKEWKLLSWWLASFHPHAQISMNVKLGPTATTLPTYPGDTAPGDTLRVRNRWADAVFVEGGVVSIVEAKIEPDPGVFSQLIHYARKLRIDPNWSDFKNAPLNLIAVVYNDDPSVSIEAPWYGVQWVVFQPKLAELPTPRAGFPAIGGVEMPLPHDFAARLSSWGIKALSGS